MTNGEKIRAMTDEELAESGMIECPMFLRNCFIKDCNECKVEWLKQEVEEK